MDSVISIGVVVLQSIIAVNILSTLLEVLTVKLKSNGLDTSDDGKRKKSRRKTKKPVSTRFSKKFLIAIVLVSVGYMFLHTSMKQYYNLITTTEILLISAIVNTLFIILITVTPTLPKFKGVQALTATCIKALIVATLVFFYGFYYLLYTVRLVSSGVFI